MRWATALKNEPRIRIHSNLDEGQTWGLAVVSIDGIDSRKLVDHLWEKHRIVITSIGHDNPDDAKLSYRALRVTPNIYTPLEEIDTFVEAMRGVIKNGLPA
jgi:selenocysteine lyase/cysteine desulfurase